ncbi:hypothetical protein ISF_10016 [Cordyceps fumosorosea ARSEF 2679]|uniref:Uncharacterized protein n=1 Tax=Cordyceps fumosorosea (strain ARSEF 2679) TaxID=1081104 RepID=A0A166W4T5_CORFA|nr:hypothetical protein ISF_10016 [Cordyceps fumosorosea ARSEF 2679]OAA34346.1 hypothetical protein ISF_10016 [Cordyceps fumosorosea ARSEF 2679]
MACVTIAELVERMAALSLQSYDITTDCVPVPLDENVHSGSSHKNEDIEIPDYPDTIRNEVANFVQLDATRFFAQAWEATFIAWMALLSITQIAPCGPLTVQGLAAAVRALDGVISGREEPYLPPRFGYLQLFHFLESLRSRIERDKKRGFIQAESHRTNAALAYELYRNAQGIPTTTSHLRRLRLLGSRWKDAVRSSPFLLLAFSKTAESFAKYPSFRKLFLMALDDVPDKLKNICGELSSIAERAAASNSESNSEQNSWEQRGNAAWKGSVEVQRRKATWMERWIGGVDVSLQGSVFSLKEGQMNTGASLQENSDGSASTTIAWLMDCLALALQHPPPMDIPTTLLASGRSLRNEEALCDDEIDWGEELPDEETLPNEETPPDEEIDWDEEILDEEALPNDETLPNGEALCNGEALTNEEMCFLKRTICDEPWLLYQTDKSQIHTFWDNIKIDTSMARDSCLADAYQAIQVLDEIISDKSLVYWKHRLAYVQLQKLLASLDMTILREKRNGHIDGRRGYGNKTVKYEILSKALEGRSSAKAIRLHVRRSRRWSLIIGGSMLLAVAYSGKAETYVTEHTDHADLSEQSRDGVPLSQSGRLSCICVTGPGRCPLRPSFCICNTVTGCILKETRPDDLFCRDSQR